MTPPPARTHGPAGQDSSGPSTPGTTRGDAANALAAPKGRRAALARAHGATLLFGASGIFGKLCQCSAPMLVCGRAIFAVAALTLAGLGKKQPPWRGLHACDLLALTISGTLLAAHFVMFFMGIQIGGVAVGTLGFACFPAFTTLIESLIYRERPSFAEMRGLGMVTLGLVCTTPSFSFAHEGTVGLLLGVASGLAYALVTVGNRLFAGHLPGLQTTWWQNTVTAVVLLPFVWRQFSTVSTLDWLWIASLGLLCSALAYVLFINSLTVLKARQAALIITLEPVYAIAAAWLVLGDAPGGRVFLGGGLILGAIFLANRR